MFESIKNKKVMITGASGGIGSCMARLFAKYGASVGIHYNNRKNESTILVDKIKKMGVDGKKQSAQNFFKRDIEELATDEGKTEIELRIYHKNFSQNGQPSEKLCPFYRRYLKLCSWEAHQMAVALYEQLFRDETKFSRNKSVADDY